MRSSVFFSLVALVASGVQGHIRLTAFNGDESCVRLPPSNSPVTDPTTDDIICNVNGNVAASGTCSIAAGASASVTWDLGAHPGPEMVYMAKVDDLKTTTITGLKWFKIAQAGYDVSNTTWASEIVNSDGGNYSFTIPSDIAAGNYLVRGETIGLHVASTQGGAQYYIGCSQVQVTGGGSLTPTDTVSFPGAYSETDPSLLINIYYPPITNYTIPGPEVVS